MKIIDFSTTATRDVTSNDVAQNRRLPNDASTAVTHADRVNLSQMAAALADAKPAASTASASPQRLEALRAAVADGTLDVDNEALAQAIVDEDASWPGLADGVHT